jgi:CheY-like chemotaxis protein
MGSKPHDQRFLAASLESSGSESAMHDPLIGPTGWDASGQCDPDVAGLERLRVVIADDNVDAALTLAALLSMQGHDVRTAHDGVEALEEIGRFDPQVVILDIGMPRMNGYKVAATLRETSADLLIIAVTGWGQEEDRHRSKAAGFDHHLVKPVDLRVLIDLLASPAARRTIH